MERSPAMFTITNIYIDATFSNEKTNGNMIFS